MHHHRCREGIPLEQTVEALPVHASLVGAAVKPLPPDPLDPIVEAVKRLTVSGDPEILVVPPQFPPQALALLRNRLVPVLSAPVGDGFILPRRPRECVMEVLARRDE